jgi:DNA-binding NarL/FixJ family response regulator
MAVNSREAVDQAIHKCADVMVMDISKPIMSGIEAPGRISNVCENTKVAILSMHHTAEYMQRALEAGAVGYVLKDSAGTELVTAIRALNAGEGYVSQKLGNAKK